MAKFPSPIRNASQARAALTVYRQALAKAADNSVMISSIGFTTNLQALLASQPDAASPLNGTALVAAKVVRSCFPRVASSCVLLRYKPPRNCHQPLTQYIALRVQAGLAWMGGRYPNSDPAKGLPSPEHNFGYHSIGPSASPPVQTLMKMTSSIPS